MHLKNDTGETLDLAILGYQFPVPEIDDGDSDWLMVSIDVRLQSGSWSSTDPSLETIDLSDLISWLENIRNTVDTKLLLVFTEPNLQFEVDNERSRLRIYFELESRPAWSPWQDSDMHDLWFELNLTQDNLTYLITSLQQELIRFPTRSAGST